VAESSDQLNLWFQQANAPHINAKIISANSSSSQVQSVQHLRLVPPVNIPQQEPEEEEDIDDPLNLQPLVEGGRDSQSVVAHAPTVGSLPVSYIQARNSNEWDQWEPAMKDEMAKMDKYKVWNVISCQPHMRVVGA